MRTLETLPPNWNKIKETFPRAKEEQAVFCYGEVLHNPFGAVITRDLEIHEAVHSKQQGKDPEKWWDRYISDPKFRVEQEIEAYGLQMYYLKNNHKVIDRNVMGREELVSLPKRVINWYLMKIAQTLSGPLYGNVITYDKAYRGVRRFMRRV